MYNETLVQFILLLIKNNFLNISRKEFLVIQKYSNILHLLEHILLHLALEEEVICPEFSFGVTSPLAY